MTHKNIFFSVLFSLVLSVAFAQKQKVVRVKTASEFVAAIASNTIIEMEYGLYNLNNYVSSEDASGYATNAYYLNNISNLTIKGVGKYPSEIVIDADEYATVLKFQNCKNIRLENIEVGHGASKGTCQGAVLGVSGTVGLNIKNCILYGSGTYGIESFANSSDIVCENTTIRSCTYGAISLNLTNKVSFTNCTFTDNGNLDIFGIRNCQQVVFNNCIIKDNTNMGRGEYAHYSNNQLFEIEGQAITLNNCIIKFNRVDYLANNKKFIKNNGSIIESNLYAKGEYGE